MAMITHPHISKSTQNAITHSNSGFDFWTCAWSHDGQPGLHRLVRAVRELQPELARHAPARSAAVHQSQLLLGHAEAKRGARARAEQHLAEINEAAQWQRRGPRRQRGPAAACDSNVTAHGTDKRTTAGNLGRLGRFALSCRHSLKLAAGAEIWVQEGSSGERRTARGDEARLCRHAMCLSGATHGTKNSCTVSAPSRAPKLLTRRLYTCSRGMLEPVAASTAG